MRHLFILCFAVFFFVTASACRHTPYQQLEGKAAISDAAFCEALASLAARHNAGIDVSATLTKPLAVALTHPKKAFISLNERGVYSRYDRAYQNGGKDAVIASCQSRLS